MEDKQSLIAEARREQIILACIETLDEYGYTNVSLTKVAKKRGRLFNRNSSFFTNEQDFKIG